VNSALTHMFHVVFLAAVCIALARSETASAQSALPSRDASVARQLFEQGRFEESLARYSAAREFADVRDTTRIEELDFNRAAVLLAMKRADEAQKLLEEVDARTRSPELRAAARYNLGSILSAQADALAKTDPAKAIDTLRAAERFFRNALIDNPSDTDAARNIEVVQRKRDLLQKRQDQNKNEQKKEDDKKDEKSPKNDDQKKDDSGDKTKTQGDSDKNPEDQQKPEDDQKPEGDQKKGPQQSSESQQDQNTQGADKQAEGDQTGQKDDPKDSQQVGQQDPKPQKPDPAKPEPQSKSDEPATAPEKATNKEPGAEAGSPDRPRESLREFDLAAARILDKERALRERLRKMFQANRSRAGKVDKDW